MGGSRLHGPNNEMWRPKHAGKARLIGLGRPWWAIAGPAAVALLALALYTWTLSRNGMANSYYAAAVRSGAVSWKAFFFGALDPGSFITVDKPPVALWVMALSARVFGFSSWSMLLPQALAGVASVLLLHRLVHRWAGDIAALLASLAFAATPVVVLVFRYNNPDAFLTLLLLLAAWTLWSAVESGSTWRLGLVGVILGFAFLTKMLQAFMVLPAFALVYLLCGPPRLGRRILQSLVALGALLVSSGWWLAVVELWPAATRPWVGGTTSNSWIDLIFTRSGGFLGTTSSQTVHLSGDPGWLRVFNTSLGGQVSWLIPLGLAGLAVGLWVTRRASRTDKARAGYVLWGLWSLVMIAVFSKTQGTFHSYYTVVLAPGIAALAGAGSVDLCRLSLNRKWLFWLLPLVIAASAAWAAVLLTRVPGYAPGLATAVLVFGVVAAAATVLVFLLVADGRAKRALVWAAVVLSLAALLAGPFAYAISTVRRDITGNQAAAGPATGGLGSTVKGASSGTYSSVSFSTEDLSVDEALIAYLEERRGGTKYLVAVQTTSASVPIILATGVPVVTIGGYKYRDPVPTVAQLQSMVAAGEVHYVLLERGGGGSGSDFLMQSAGEIDQSAKAILQAVTDWVMEEGSVVPATEYSGKPSEGTLYYIP